MSTTVATTSRPVSYEGRGDVILTMEKLETGAVVADVTHDGIGAFVVAPLDGTTKLLSGNVRVIGRYRGRVFLDHRTNRLKIRADGNWTVQISPLSAIERFSETYDGDGDNVIAYEGAGGVIAMTHEGVVNFVVKSSNDIAGLANEVGRYTGETAISAGPSILSITADGSWSVMVEER